MVRGEFSAGTAGTIRRTGAARRVESFDLQEGDVLLEKYEVVGHLGRGWEGEVYLVRELGTGIERAAKFYFPHRNPRNRTLTYYAKKLHRLRHCPILIQYHTREVVDYEGVPITFVVSEYVEGELLSEFIARQPGKRLDPFQALHLLHALVTGIESVHNLREYQGQCEELHGHNWKIEVVGRADRLDRIGLAVDFKELKDCLVR